MLRRLPLDVLSIVKSDLRPVGRLDYAANRIQMCVNSPWQPYRLNSCAKEPETVAWIERNVRPGDTFYDIGANVGAYSLVAFAVSTARRPHLRVRTGFRDVCRAVPQHPAEPRRRSVVRPSPSRSATGRPRDFRYSETTPGAALHNWQASAAGETHAPS